MITKKIFRVSKINLIRLSSSNVARNSSNKPSYVHCADEDPFKYVTLGQVLKNAAEKYGDRPALISCSEKSQISFNEALFKADSVASSLLSLGLEKGDRVGIWSPNFEFWYVSMMAIARAGLICVTLNPSYTPPELNYCINKVGIKAIIAPEAFRKFHHYEMLSTLIPDLKNTNGTCIENNSVNSLRHVIINSDEKLPGVIKFNDLVSSATDSDRSSIEHLQSSISPDSGCNIQFTSGTTGLPKATLLSHFGMVNNAFYIGIRNNLNKKYSRLCMPLPMFHVGGCIISSIGSLWHGITVVFPSPHFNAEDTVRAIVDENCNMFSGTPTFLVDIIAKQRELNLKMPEIDLVCVGGSVLSPQLVKDAENVLKVNKNCIKSVYGLTETASAVFQTLPEDDNQVTEEFVGVAGSHVEAKVIDKDGNTVPFGVAGELCIRSVCNMLGYWGDPEKTKETLGIDRWLKTGDQFVLHENGYGKIVGRIKDMIIRGGENLFPKEIEDFLNTHENILEAHVIGIPDDRLGEEVGAFIRLKDPSKLLTQDDIKSFCEGSLAHFKIPKYLIIVEEFPRTNTGKVLKYKFLEVFDEKIQKFK